MKTIKILGETWNLKTNKVLDGAWGACDYTSRTIYLCKNFNKLRDEDNSYDNINVHKNKVIRHEVIHAMMLESGIVQNTDLHNEAVVDWIARNHKKMNKIFKKLEVI